ncbi:hypothetical protein EVAR_8747_1 [Eumeta japonica]|uniref:Uncharacterized protein n=1 Tax=Eumeta variegata TaxID=151549 RepID=A0A4C1TTN2_EUMVA|nr:hypothetical protein EVAR_8747_1 [Eumeta japonica]
MRTDKRPSLVFFQSADHLDTSVSFNNRMIDITVFMFSSNANDDMTMRSCLFRSLLTGWLLRCVVPRRTDHYTHIASSTAATERLPLDAAGKFSWELLEISGEESQAGWKLPCDISVFNNGLVMHVVRRAPGRGVSVGESRPRTLVLENEC